MRLKRGRALFSFWPDVQKATRGYGELHDRDLLGRTRTLDALDTAIAAWRHNQAQRTEDELVRQKKAALTALEALIATERLEIRTAQMGPPPTIGSGVATSPSVPMRAPQLIPEAVVDAADAGCVPSVATLPSLDLPPLRGTLAGEAPPATTFSVTTKDFDLSVPTSTPSRPGGASKRQIRSSEPRLPSRLRIRVHFTKPEHVPAIRDEGLIAGKGKGIGLARGGIGEPDVDAPKQFDTQDVYTIDPAEKERNALQCVAAAGGVAVVVVVASRDGDPDKNYLPVGVAQKYGERVPPVRDSTRGDVFSFALPMTPRTETGLADFVNRLRPDRALRKDEVVGLVDRHLRLHLGMLHPEIMALLDSQATGSSASSSTPVTGGSPLHQ